LDSLSKAAKKSSSKPIQVRFVFGLGFPTTRYDVWRFHSKIQEDLNSMTELKTDIDISIAYYRSTQLSWNHSKIIAVDGKTAIVGGHNMWSGSYLQNNDPVHDVSMIIQGDASIQAHKFADVLWKFISKNRDSVLHFKPLISVHYASTKSQIPEIVPLDLAPKPRSEGDIPMLAVGKLGLGIELDGTANSLSAPNITLPNWEMFDSGKSDSENDIEYDKLNPSETALRALIDSAKNEVFLSQQDLQSVKFSPDPYFHRRLFESLVDALIREVKVIIIVSNPGAHLGGVSGSIFEPYSNSKSISTISDGLKQILKDKGKSDTETHALLVKNLTLSSLRFNDTDTWNNGNYFANHAKLICVDEEVFYIGSQNLYPAWLQEFGYIIEDKKTAKSLVDEYLTPLLKNSKRVATYGNPLIWEADSALARTGINALIVYNDKLYAGVEDGSIHVRDANGWNNEKTMNSSINTLSIYRDKLYAGVEDGSIHVRDADGWNVDYILSMGIGVNALIVYNDKLYAGLEDGSIHVRDANGWNNVLIIQAGSINTLTVYDGKLYVGTQNGSIYVPLVSTTQNDGKMMKSVNTLAVYNDKLYAGVEDGSIHVRDADGWNVDYILSMGIGVNTLAVYNDKLYAGVKNGQIYVHDPSISWKKDDILSKDKPTNTIAVYDGKLYAGLEDGTIYVRNY